MDTSINIIASGDYCPTGLPESLCIEGDHQKLYDPALLRILKEKDIAITNLECPLTDSSESIIKSGPGLKAAPRCAENLVFASFDVVTLANNHINDFGEKGVLDTLEVCQSHGMKTVGAGSNIHKAREPLIICIKGRKVAIINCAENEFSSATSGNAGANPFDIIEVSRQLINAKMNNDIVLVIVHGGNERYELPSPRIVKTFRYFAELGASAVLSHHSHYASGYELYKNVPIFYGLGNFLFPTSKKEDIAWNKGYLVSLKFNCNGSSEFTLIPYFQCYKDLRVTLMDADNKEVFLAKIKLLSEIIADDESLNDRWERFCEANFKYYTNQIYSLSKFERVMRNINRSFFKKKYMDRSSELLNLYRCESHRDASIKILEQMARLDKA